MSAQCASLSELFCRFDNFQKEMWRGKWVKVTVPLVSDYTSARGTKGSWAGDRNEPVVSGSELSSSCGDRTPPPPNSASLVDWTSQSLSPWGLWTSFPGCLAPVAGLIVFIQALIQLSSGPSPTSNPFGYDCQLSLGAVSNFSLVFKNKAPLLKNPFPLTRLGPLWPRKTGSI